MFRREKAAKRETSLQARKVAERLKKGLSERNDVKSALGCGYARLRG